MSETKWIWVERVGWVFGIVGAVFGIVWGIVTYQAPVIVKPDNPRASASVPEPAPSASSATHVGAPSERFSSLADRQSVMHAFGNLMEGRGESKYVALSGNHEVMTRTQETLAVSDQQLVYEGTVTG